ncbi:MAG: CBS domain-containing protein [Candidatus Hydrothermarchaeales archaeon]
MERFLNLDAKVGELMTKDLVTVKFSEPVLKLIQRMNEKEISGVVVVDNIGEVMGVISALDIFKLFKEESMMSMGNLIAEDIMTPFVMDVYPEDSLEDAATKMLEHNIHRLIVTSPLSKKKTVGIITSTDLLREMSKKIEKT